MRPVQKVWSNWTFNLSKEDKKMLDLDFWVWQWTVRWKLCLTLWLGLKWKLTVGMHVKVSSIECSVLGFKVVRYWAYPCSGSCTSLLAGDLPITSPSASFLSVKRVCPDNSSQWLAGPLGKCCSSPNPPNYPHNKPYHRILITAILALAAFVAVRYIMLVWFNWGVHWWAWWLELSKWWCQNSIGHLY